MGLNLGVARQEPSKCRGLRAIFCPVPMYSALGIRVREVLPPSNAFSGPSELHVSSGSSFLLYAKNVSIRYPTRGGLIIGTLCGLGRSFSLPHTCVCVGGRVPSKTKLNNNSSSTTCTVGYLGRLCELKLSSRRVRGHMDALKTSYTFFVHGHPMFTANVKGRFAPVRLSLAN